MIKKSLIVLLAGASLLSACDAPKQTIGAVGGGAVGAAVGSMIGSGRGQLIAAAAGGVLGALAGGYMGSQLDAQDRAAAAKTAQQCFESTPTGKSSQWVNPDTGHRGEFTPMRTYQSQQGYCREFHHKVYVGDKAENAYGTACRQPDGSWKIVESK